MPTRLAPCVALLLALAATAAAQAPAAPVDEFMLSRSPVVVYGEVLSTSLASSGDGPVVDSVLAVEDVLKGQAAGSRIVVRNPGGLGGRVDGERLALAEGDRVLLFLEAEESGAYAIAEYPLGMFWEARMGGRSLLLGWGAAAAGSEAAGDRSLRLRDAVRFRQWIADRVSGAEPPAAYSTTSRTEAPAGALGASTAPCTSTSDVFQFDGGYRVRLCYRTPAGDVGEGRSGIWASGQGGLFWFFDRGNPEALIKILDGCDYNQHRWVFFAPVSDLGLHLQVIGPNEETWTYTNPVGRTAPTAADTAAFSCADEPEEEPPPDDPPTDDPDLKCKDQRSLALRHEAYFGGRGVVREWDGTPIRVDIVRNFPGFVTDADLEGLLEPVGGLADQIEARLGYRIIEAGGVIDVPPNAPAGWDQDFNRFFESWRVRERGQVLAFYMNDDNPQDWDGRGGSIMSAHACCGTTSYNKRALGAWWNDGDPCCQGNANGREGAVLVHELFHLLGFKHSYDQFELTGVEMSRGGLDRPWVTGSRVFYATPSDVDNLGCVFPEGG